MSKINLIIKNIQNAFPEKTYDECLNRISDELCLSGINVLRDFVILREQLGLSFFEYESLNNSGGMSEFYKITDSFVFELSAWHLSYERNEWKNAIANEIIRHLGGQKGSCKILMLGDGIGYDSVGIYDRLCKKLNLDITYFEFENSKSYCFAKELFKNNNKQINMLGKLNELKTGYYDVVCCLDVLEHVEHVEHVVENINQYLKDDGFCFISEGFKSIELLRPTHLKMHKDLVGSIISIFKKHKLFFLNRIQGRIFVFSKLKRKRNLFVYLQSVIKLKISSILFKLRYIEYDDASLLSQYYEIEKKMRYIDNL